MRDDMKNVPLILEFVDGERLEVGSALIEPNKEAPLGVTVVGGTIHDSGIIEMLLRGEQFENCSLVLDKEHEL